jgi:hypothetical protein
LKKFGPLNLIAVASSLASLGLLIWAILIKDGVATIGIVIMSLAAPCLCIGTKWSLSLPYREPHRSFPEDVVFRNREGTFTIVHCTESIARAIYFAPERPVYTVKSWVGIGTGGIVGGLTLIVAIVLFGNCGWTMQAALAVTYALLNVAYWLAAVLTIRDPKLAWDCSWVKVDEIGVTTSTSFTPALWHAMRLLRSTSWVKEANWMPRSAAWEAWLQVASEHLDDPDWDPTKALTEALKMAASRD